MKILNFSEAEQQLCMKTIYALVPSQIQWGLRLLQLGVQHISKITMQFQFQLKKNNKFISVAYFNSYAHDWSHRTDPKWHLLLRAHEWHQSHKLWTLKICRTRNRLFCSILTQSVLGKKPAEHPPRTPPLFTLKDILRSLIFHFHTAKPLGFTKLCCRERYLENYMQKKL